MRNRFYQQFIILLVLFLAIISFVACDKTSRKSKKNKDIIVTHDFPNGNWSFEEEVVKFDFDISDTTKDYQISVLLRYDTSVNILENIPLSLTLDLPDGMQSISKSQFNLSRVENKDIYITDNGSIAECPVIVFPKRRFKAIGTYHLTVYRRAKKADNYGFVSLSAVVSVL